MTLPNTTLENSVTAQSGLNPFSAIAIGIILPAIGPLFAAWYIQKRIAEQSAPNTTTQAGVAVPIAFNFAATMAGIASFVFTAAMQGVIGGLAFYLVQRGLS